MTAVGNKGVTSPALKMPTTARKEAAVVVAMMLALSLWQSIAGYRSADRHAEDLVSALAKTLEYQVDSSFRSIDNLLAEATDRIDPERWPDAEMVPWFRSRLAGFPEVRFLTVVGRDGRSAGPPLTAKGLVGQSVWAGDREHFLYHQNHPEDLSLHVGDPVIARVDGSAMIPVSRVIKDTSGRFRGYVLVAADPVALHDMLQSVLIEDAGGAGIARIDGTFLARAPGQSEMFGKFVGTSPLFRDYVSRAKSGVAHHVAQADGNRKISAFRRLDRFPLMVQVGITTDTAFAGWRFRLYTTLGLICVFALALFRAATLLDRREQTREALTLKTSELRELAIRDDLTGLLNKRAFYETLRHELAVAEQRKRPLALIYFDLNEFKQLNDSKGHHVGDLLLAQVAAAMRQSMRDADHCCRYGGDEFCVVMPNTGAAQATQACRRLIAAFELGDTRGVSFSIGVAETGGDGVLPMNALVREADALMYAAKALARLDHGHHVLTRAELEGRAAGPFAVPPEPAPPHDDAMSADLAEL